MKKLTLILAAIVLVFSASSALAMNGQADRYNDERTFPHKVEVAKKSVEVKAALK